MIQQNQQSAALSHLIMMAWGIDKIITYGPKANQQLFDAEELHKTQTNTAKLQTTQSRAKDK